MDAIEAGSSAGTRLQRKRRFYADLDAAFVDSDEESDPGRKAAAQVLHGASDKKSSAAGKQGSDGLPRSASDTYLAKDAGRECSDLVQFELPNTSSGRVPPKLTKSATVTGAPGKVMPAVPPATAIPKLPKTSGKRKRDGTIDLVPDAQQIFKGMHFFFFPNDDKNPARAMRMMKAIGYGATWQKEWNDSVTHVVADKLFDFATLTKHVKLDGLPGEVVVVTENYPSDCISFRTILDPKQKRFQVKGHAPSGQSKHDAVVPLSSPSGKQKSLELKPAGRSVMARPPESPRTTDEAASSQPVIDPPAEPLQPLQHDKSNRPAAVAAEPQGSAPKTVSTAEFDAAVRQAKKLQYVPLEEEGEETRRPTSSEGHATDDEDQTRPRFDAIEAGLEGQSKVPELPRQVPMHAEAHQ